MFLLAACVAFGSCSHKAYKPKVDPFLPVPPADPDRARVLTILETIRNPGTANPLLAGAAVGRK